jgi:diguanylate cyclase (GGDEF)-like protein
VSLSAWGWTVAAMTLIAAIREVFRIPIEKPDLLRSQVRAFSRQIPLLYFVVAVNADALAWTHFGVAPLVLTTVVPTLLTLACLIRAGMWFRRGEQPMSDAAVVHRLRTSVALTGGIAVVFLAWSLSLYPYGDAYAQGHVAFFLAITVVSCIFCLMHSRPAALLLTGVAVIPFTIFFVSTGRPVFIAIALDMLLVSAAMIYVLLAYSRDLANMIAYQKMLVETHEQEAERSRSNAETERAAQREILKHAERFKSALNNMLHGLAMFDQEDRLIVCNERYAQMYSLPEHLTQPGVEWSEITAYRVDAIGYRNFNYDDPLEQRRRSDGYKSSVGSATRDLADGRTIFIRHQPIREGGWVAVHEDVTERHRAEERLSHMARHDALTGLANRFFLQERMQLAVAGLPNGEEFSVICLDLDHFKETNDALGHPVGDALLREIASRLTKNLPASDLVARIGGDEFAILHMRIIGTDEIAGLARRLLTALTEPYLIEGHQINIGASAGIALAPEDQSAAAPLLRLADIALYRAKSECKGSFRFYEAEMDAALQARRQLEIDLRRALIEEELEVYFQPINDARTGAVRSFEALARWRHPERGMIAPAEFIPLAEQTGLIVPLGEWILRAACREAAHWPDEVGVSVNLSALQFKAPALTATIHNALKDTRLAAGRLELEITESVLLDGTNDNLSILRDFHALGVKIALDDFGTGYSSLSYLRSFPFDKLKIDQSFIRNSDVRDGQEIVKAIANLGQTLGITTTAEGVETEDQLARMVEYGCTEAQGYLFSRPVPASQVAWLLNRSLQAAWPAGRRDQPRRPDLKVVGYDI